jgi:TonB-linked SusC/RagA family outer membrane protein
MQFSRLRQKAGAALLFAACLLGARPAEAQDAPFTLRGTVVDAATQRPLASATVSVRNTELRAVTNAAGQFTLRAPVNPGTYTLAVAALGRATVTRQVTLGGQQEVALGTIALTEAVIQLDEVVVTGTGMPTERREVANAVSTVRGDEINAAPAASGVDAALQGRVAGAVISENSGQPGGGISIRLRGTSTIFGGAEPLIVVDGVIIDNNDAALVGLSSNATRGGSAMSNRLADIAPGDIERVEVLKGAAAAALYGSRANSGVIQIFTRRGQQGRPLISVNTEFGTSETPRRLALNQAPAAGYTDVLYVTKDKKIGQPVTRYDMQDFLFRRGGTMNTQVSVSGGSDETSYYLSAGHRDETGILQATDYTRTSIRGKLTQQLSDIFEVSANANYVQSQVNNVPEGEQTIGLLTTIIFTPTTFNPEFNSTTGRYPYAPVSGFAANPLDVINNWDFPEEVVRLIGGLEVNARLHPDFTLRWMLGYDDYRQESRFYRPAQSLSATDAGSVSNPVRFSRQINNELTASLDRTLGPIGLNSTAGFRYTTDEADIISASASNLPPGQELVGGGTQFASQSFSEVRTVGGYLQERLSFNDRLFVTGGLNVEASSAFGEEERWQLFPRVGASWVVHEEPFWANSALGSTVSTLRVRGAYGQTGSQPPGAYLRFENYVDVAYSGMAGYVASTTVGNPDLAPERQREVEFGLEAGLFDNRALLDLTFYNQVTSDLVLPVPVAPSLGAQQQFQNVGEVSNRGMEATLTTLNVTRSNFAWRTRFTYGRNRNRVEKLAPGSDTIMVASLGGDYLNAVIKGQPLGVFYGGIYERDANGNIVYRRVTADSLLLPSRARDTITVNGVKSFPFARRIIGNPHPDFTLALSNEFDVGENLGISFLLDGRFGNDVANFTRRITELFGTDKVVEREISGDTIARTFSQNPASRGGIFEEYVEDGTFVKLREVAVRYRLGGGLTRWFGAGDAEIRVAGRNLHTWTDYRGLDPEVNLFSNNAVARGVDFATTPIPRSFVVGLNFSF